MRITAVTSLMLIIVVNCHSIERTEAQRYYDLAVSYVKSDLYEDGLKTLNQVAFLYPDSDVADDALYQLALIRERVGNGELDIAREESLEAQGEVLKRLTGKLIPDMMISIMAQIKGEAVFDLEKEKAIAQYLLALDYLNTLSERYPDSDRLGQSTRAFERILTKIDGLMQKRQAEIPKEKARDKNIKRDAIVLAGIVGGVAACVILLITVGKYIL